MKKSSRPVKSGESMRAIPFHCFEDDLVCLVVLDNACKLLDLTAIPVRTSLPFSHQSQPAALVLCNCCLFSIKFFPVKENYLKKLMGKLWLLYQRPRFALAREGRSSIIAKTLLAISSLLQMKLPIRDRTSSQVQAPVVTPRASSY